MHHQPQEPYPDDLGVLALDSKVQGSLLVNVLDVQVGIALQDIQA